MTTLPIADMDSPSTRETPMTTTNEIADKIASEQGLSKAQSKTIVEAVFASIATAAGSGAETSIPGFGKFKVKSSPARDGRNPATGETIKIAASKNTADDYNPSGVVDISRFLGYEPASIFLAGTMSCGSSMSVLINPKARLTPKPKVFVPTPTPPQRSAPISPGTRTVAPTTSPRGTNDFDKSECFYLCKVFPTLKWVSLNCGPCT